VVIAFEVRPTGAKMAALDKWIQGDGSSIRILREKMRFRNPNDATNPGTQATAKVMFDGYEKMSWTITPTEMQSHHSESGNTAGLTASSKCSTQTPRDRDHRQWHNETPRVSPGG
jgi:hypothetical protein